MSQQHMEFNPGSGQEPASYSVGYEEAPHNSYSSSGSHGQKLSWQDADIHATAGQRLALAIVSLAMFMVIIFGLVLLALASNAAPWIVLPILFVIVLYSALAIVINVVFNRRP